MVNHAGKTEGRVFHTLIESELETPWPDEVVAKRLPSMRRAFDTLFAAVGVALLSPLFAVIALAIKLEDGGPVFYSQLRIGKDFREFRLLKFRSMITDADRAGLLTVPRDARITRVGKLLRKYKLDELPQLINVVKGEMQLVGPRPELKRYVDTFHVQYALLLQYRPGITDPATLAFRHEEEILEAQRPEEQYVSQILPRKLQLSLEYQRRRSFLRDLDVLLQTVLGLSPLRRGSSPAGESKK